MGEYLGLSAADVASNNADTDMFIFCVNNQESFKAEKEERTTYKNLAATGPEGSPLGPYPTSAAVAPPPAVPQGIFTRRARRVQTMKNSPNYTNDIGEDFRIIGDEQTVDIENAKPVLKLSKVPSGYKITFGLQNFFDGVHIYRKRPEQENFRFLATDTRSPYIDTDEQVNGTEYYAYFLVDDDEVGQQSDIVTVEL